MSGKSVSEAFKEVAGRLRSAGVLLLLTHDDPDGDALGSMAALAAAARAAGKTAHVLARDTVSRRYEFLLASEQTQPASRAAQLADRADLIVILDTCALSQLTGLDPAVLERREKIVVIDHHSAPEELGAVQWIDTSAAAVGVMILELIEALGWDLSPDGAEALLAAIVSDTGWMRFSNTEARCLRAISRLTEAGVEMDKLYAKLYQRDRPQRLRLLERMLGSLALHCDDRLAVMMLRKEDFQQTGARQDETENLINEALRLESIEVVVLLVENAECVRVSLRSRDVVDVAAIARRFGGGGHARASGLRRPEDIDALREQLIAACDEALRTAGTCK